MSRPASLEAPPLVGNVTHLHARSSPGPTDAALVIAARAGERWAREALFRRHARMANVLAFRLLGRDQEVPDVVQDAYVTVLDSLDRLQDPSAFGSFLAGVIVNRVRRVVRRRRLARRLGLLPAAEPIDLSALIAPTAPPDAVAELQAIYRIVEELPTDERLALLLRKVEGLELAEVARLCECSLATAKRRIAAAEKRVQAAQVVAPPSARASALPTTGSPRRMA